MTDWIDALAEKLNDDQKRANQLYANALLHARLIDERAPEFFQALSQQVTTLAAELNEKLGASLGGVRAVTQDQSFTVSSQGPVESVTISGRLDVRGQQITLDTTRKGTRFVTDDDPQQVFRLRIDNHDRLIASREGEWFHDPAEMASALLRAAFTSELFRPY